MNPHLHSHITVGASIYGLTIGQKSSQWDIIKGAPGGRDQGVRRVLMGLVVKLFGKVMENHMGGLGGSMYRL